MFLSTKLRARQAIAEAAVKNNVSSLGRVLEPCWDIFRTFFAFLKLLGRILSHLAILGCLFSNFFDFGMIFDGFWKDFGMIFRGFFVLSWKKAFLPKH